MMNLTEVRNRTELIDQIDWEMTPEEAVRLYLEWGNNWAGGKYVIRSKDDVTLYFVVNTWKGEPVVYLVRRNSEAAEELAQFPLPAGIRESFLESIGHNKGVYALSEEVRDWLQKELRAK